MTTGTIGYSLELDLVFSDIQHSPSSMTTANTTIKSKPQAIQ